MTISLNSLWRQARFGTAVAAALLLILVTGCGTTGVGVNDDPEAPPEPTLEGERSVAPGPIETEQQPEAENTQTEIDRIDAALDVERPVPLDPQVRHGVLDNGLTYYVRENGRPENRAELRLVVNAGSLQETEEQRGLAHFVEHMAFNGTENFEKQELVDYLEGIGMRFGPDLNAYTSFDETVYMLQIPTDDPEILEKGLDILDDWAHRISFEDEEIDKERGVVIEEWRSRQGAGSRILDKQLPVTFHESRYAERLPIGLVEVLENAPYEQFRRFYRDWYRPELMAVIAVGDIDPDAMEAEIKERFGRIAPNPDAPAREDAEIPGHEETLVSIATDPEATSSRVNVMWKRPPYESVPRIANLREDVVDELYHGMMNSRLRELAQQADPPYQFGFAFDSGLGRTRSSYQLSASVRNGGVVRGLETILLEAKRVRDHGFAAAELERGKTNFLRGVERAYEERDKQESRSLAGRYVGHYLQGNPAPGIEFLTEYYNRVVPEITLDEVNRRAEQWMQGEEGMPIDANRVILVSGPDSEEADLPSEERLLAVFDEIDDVATTPWVDRTSDDPLVAIPPRPGRITAEETIPHVDATRWTLSNGIEVYLKPTDLKNDQVLMAATSPGGHSLASDDEFFDAAQASNIVSQMGLGTFGPIELRKKLTGKAAGASPFIGELGEGLNGSASPKDLEAMFQLTYLSVTAPRLDLELFESLKSRLSGFLENQKASPSYWYGKKQREVMFGDHPRRQGFEVEDVERLDAQAALDFYRERFADTSDFTFYFVGNFTLEQMRPLVETWIASLPTTDRDEDWRDVGAEIQGTSRSFVVEKGLEPKAQVQLTFFGDAEWSVEDSNLASATGQALRIRLREVLREDLGGVYGVSAGASISRIPKERYSASISFGTDPARLDELLDATWAEIERLKTDGPDQETVDKVKESWRRGRETQLEQNGFWLNVLRNYVDDGIDWAEFDRFEERLDLVTPDAIREMAQLVFDQSRVIEGRLVPESDAAHDEADAAGADSGG